MASSYTEPNNSIHFKGSNEFVHWLSDLNVSLVFSSYQLGKFFLIGRHPPAGLSVFQRNFARCMGIAIDATHDVIYLSSLYQIWKFKNSLPDSDDYQGYDRIYTPQASFLTGDIDVHDMDLMANGQLIFVNTLFSCLSTRSEDYSFEVFWKPKFISKLAPEDRCHLNGVALLDGKPKYVTLFAQTNSPNGWRDHKKEGGAIVDVTNDEIICSALSMPHSPRIHEHRLWVLNSGTGYLGYIDLASGKFNEVVFCPGYLRGLKFIDHYAIVGLSKIRKSNFIATTILEDNLTKHHETAHCGICVIDLKKGVVAHKLELTGALMEIYDVGILQNIQKPMAIGIENDDIRRVITIPPHHDGGCSEFIVLENLRRD